LYFAIFFFWLVEGGGDKSSDQTLQYSFLCSTDQTSDWHLIQLRIFIHHT